MGPRSAEDPTPRKVIEAGKVKECRHCGTKHPLYANGTMCFMAFFYIWERDLIQMAREHEGWRSLAHGLGFRDEKIDAPWTFPDEGRLIPYRRIKDGEFLTK
jgi:hypothetical protein